MLRQIRELRSDGSSWEQIARRPNGQASRLGVTESGAYRARVALCEKGTEQVRLMRRNGPLIPAAARPRSSDGASAGNYARRP